MDKVKLKCVKLHAAEFYPGLGTLGPSLYDQPTAQNMAYELTLVNDGRMVEIVALDKVKKPIKLLFPISSFAYVVPS